MSPVTRWIGSLGAALFARDTLERLIIPILSDIETERRTALVTDRRWRARWILLSGCAGLGRAVVLHGVQVCARVLVTGDGTAGAVRAAAGAFVVLTAVLTLPFVLGDGRRHADLALYAVPGAIPLSIPLAVAFAIAWRWHRGAACLAAPTILVLGLAGSGLAFATMEWLVPNANQSFRVAMAQRLGKGSDFVPRGVNELALSEMVTLVRTRSDLNGNPDAAAVPAALRGLAARRSTAGIARSELNMRIALGLATTMLALFAFAIAGIDGPRNHPSTVFVGTVFAYAFAFVQLSTISRLHPFVVWLPNVVLAAVSVTLLCGGSIHHRGEQA